MSVSCDLLTPTHIFDTHGKMQGLFLYSGGSVEYFSNEHFHILCHTCTDRNAVSCNISSTSLYLVTVSLEVLSEMSDVF